MFRSGEWHAIDMSEEGCKLIESILWHDGVVMVYRGAPTSVGVFKQGGGMGMQDS